jgi:hypothetical protein
MEIFGCRSTKWIHSDFDPPQVIGLRQEKLKKAILYGRFTVLESCPAGRRFGDGKPSH